MKKSPLNSEGLSDTYVKGKMLKFFIFATEIYNLFLNCQCKSSLHRFYELIFLFCFVMRRRVARIPGWLRECRWWKMVFRGMRGWKVLVEILPSKERVGERGMEKRGRKGN
jgi:hypothetical protein